MKRSKKYLKKIIIEHIGTFLSFTNRKPEIKRYGKYCTLEGEKDAAIRNGFRFKLAEKQLDQMAKEDNL